MPSPVSASLRHLRIVCIISSLRGGGAELVLSRLASALTARGHEVVVITFSRPESDVQRLAPRVTRVALGLERESTSVWQTLSNTWERVAVLRRQFRELRPDVLISFMDVTNVLALLANVGTGIPIVISERVDPRFHPIVRPAALLRRALYGRAHALVLQTRSLLDWAHELPNSPPTFVIPNPVFVPDEAVGAGDHLSENHVLAVGRLSAQKGFDSLIRAFARVKIDHPGLKLVILGEGVERRPLEQLVEELSLANHVELPGHQSTAEWLARARLFVLSSRYEGFPNALAEAMAAARPIVATRCASGPEEMLVDGESGILVDVDDIEAMARAMSRLLADPEYAFALGQRARRDARSRFAPDVVWNAWEATLHAAIGRGRSGDSAALAR